MCAVFAAQSTGHTLPGAHAVLHHRDRQPLPLGCRVRGAGAAGCCKSGTIHATGKVTWISEPPTAHVGVL